MDDGPIHKPELIEKAVKNILAEKNKNRLDDNDQLLLSRLLSELESLNEGDSIVNEGGKLKPNTNTIASSIEEEKEEENGNRSEIGAEEIVNELRNVKKQNFVTHCLLSAVIVLTLAWQISEVSLILKLKDGLSHPFKSLGSMVFGKFGGNGQNGGKQQNSEEGSSSSSSSGSSLHMPELPHVDFGLNGDDKK